MERFVFMLVLEGTDTDKNRTEDLLAYVGPDKSVKKFDQILRADQVAPGTRRTYFW
jgi:hypothetical protein